MISHAGISVIEENDEYRICKNFQSQFLKNFRSFIKCGFLFGSIAKGFYKPGHDIDIFIIFENDNHCVMKQARNDYFFLHEKFDAIADIKYPGEFFTEQQIEDFLCSPIQNDLDWRRYDHATLDQLFILEVLSGPKTAICGDLHYLNQLQIQSLKMLESWRSSFDLQIITMSNWEVLKDIVFPYQPSKPNLLTSE